MLPSDLTSPPTVIARYTREKEQLIWYFVSRMDSALAQGLYKEILSEFITEWEKRWQVRRVHKLDEAHQRDLDANTTTLIRQFLLRYFLWRAQLTYPGLAPDASPADLFSASMQVSNLPAVGSALPVWAPPPAGPGVPPGMLGAGTHAPSTSLPSNPSIAGVNPSLPDVESMWYNAYAGHVVDNAPIASTSTAGQHMDIASTSNTPSNAPIASTSTAGFPDQCPVAQYSSLVTAVMVFLSELVDHTEKMGCPDCIERANRGN